MNDDAKLKLFPYYLDKEFFKEFLKPDPRTVLIRKILRETPWKYQEAGVKDE